MDIEYDLCATQVVLGRACTHYYFYALTHSVPIGLKSMIALSHPPFPIEAGGLGSPAPAPWPSPLTAIGGMSARWTGHRDNLGDELPSSTRMDGHPGSAGGLP